jgi:16S rRNA (guanine966-N2)-methyltransferase
MRIISGTARGTKLLSPKGGVRPTLDYVKESLFNILAPDIGGAAFLDLFCGSGAMGLEALSRGAAHTVFVDIDIQTAARNIAKTKTAGSSRVIKSDAVKAVRLLAAESAKFDIIYADPPYGDCAAVQAVLEAVSAGKLLTVDGTLLAETPLQPHGIELVIPEDMVITRSKVYSNCTVSFIRYKH